MNTLTDPLLLVPPREPRRVPALHGLLWLQQGFRLFTAQPARWGAVLGLWLWLTIVLPTLLGWGLQQVREVGLIALRPIGLADTLGDALSVLPMLVPLAMVLLFPLVFAGLMVGCQAAARGEPLRPAHLIAGFEREPGRLVTVGGINAVGQILMSAVIGWLVRSHFADVDLSSLNTAPLTPSQAALVLQRLSEMLPSVLPVLVLQIVLMAALWFTPPLLAFHQQGALAAVRASVQACARNAASLIVYALAMVLMLAFVGAISLSVQDGGVVFGLIALMVLAAALTTVIGSVYVSYCDIFDQPLR